MPTKQITMSLGEVLWDMLPDGKALGGAPTNVAWHASQLGAEAHVVSAVGDDGLGREIADRLGAMNLDLSAVKTVAGKPTGTVDATLDSRGNATYVIHENVAWDFLPVTPEILAMAGRTDAINYGSLAQRTANGREAHYAILDAVRPGAVRIFDINLRAPFVFEDVLDGGMRRASVVKMNREELPILADMFGWASEPEAAILQLFAAYPAVKHVIVTQGAEGAWWHDGKTLYKEPPKRYGEIEDTIGAGDSVTAASMMGLLKGWPVRTIASTALEVAGFVCSSRGGTPKLPAELRGKFIQPVSCAGL